jgi:hypothetical protein
VADKVLVKVRGSDTQRSNRRTCERRSSKRMLCSDLVQIQWTDDRGTPYREIAILENLSLAGVGLFTGVPVAEGTAVRIAVNDVQLSGCVRGCVFRENGYIVGLELDADSKWAQSVGRHILPEHFLDVSLLDFE